MTDTETTQSSWRTRAATAWAFAVAHKDWTIPAACFVLGAIVGKVI